MPHRLRTASPQNRAVLIDWLYQVHDRFKLLSDTFHMTIQLIDRYLQVIDASKHELQLIGSTGMDSPTAVDFSHFSRFSSFVNCMQIRRNDYSRYE